MGYGDEIMASGHALTVYKNTRGVKKIRIVDKINRPRWSDLWENLDWILQPKELHPYYDVQNGPGCRPYIQGVFNRRQGQTWTTWKANDNIGAIAFRQQEIEFFNGLKERFGKYVVIEPNIFPNANPNKQWGWDNWVTLVSRLHKDNIPIIQIGAPTSRVLPAIEFVKTLSFRYGAAAIAGSVLSVLPEGGLHHAAAATHKPAIVLFGGCCSPTVTGYDFHVNIGSDDPCGRWVPCSHCNAYWKTLEPDYVLDVVKREYLKCL